MSHDPIVEKGVEKDEFDYIITMADRVEYLMGIFPSLVKERSLTHNLLLDLPINEEKMNEVVKLKILSILLDMPYDELKIYLGYE